jgi:ATP-dependent exoDNAse (exonuclease V) beta subunit
MTEKKFKIYSSSAGSGKTYTLTKEYLKLALQNDNPHYFKTILAITFTNDAANEMKVRIVNTLRHFAYLDQVSAKERKNAESLLNVIAEELRERPAKIQERARKVFMKILYNYADFSVSTIDKFVNKVTSAFTRELEIPYNYEVDLDTEQLLQNAIDRVLEKVGRENKEKLSDFVVDWVTQKAEEGKNWSKVAEDLAEFAKNLMNENAYIFLAQLRELAMEDFKVIARHLADFQVDLEKKIKNWAKEAQGLIDGQGLEDKDFSYGKNGIAGYFRKFIDKKFEIPEKFNANIRKMIEQDKWASDKKGNPKIDLIKNQLADFIEKTEKNLEKYGGIFELIDNLRPNLYKLALIQEIEAELADVKRENNSIHISDTNKKIAEIISTEPVPYIYERVGEKYHHILIDEFQDTSLLQWQNLLPLVENNLSEGHFNLIVGDSKQAIYRWRGGEMEQLVYLYKNKIEDLVEMSAESSPFTAERYEMLQLNHLPAQLNYNYRSTAEVIEFNNTFFKTIVESDFGAIYPLLPQIYDEDFAQKIPENARKTGGHVEIEFLGKGDLYQEQTHQKILETIDKLTTQGYAWRDIAILTRGNLQGSQIANLLKDNKIDVISQDSLTLISDDKVRFLVAMLKVIHRPEDRLSKSEALYLFYKVVKGIIPDPHTNQAIKDIIGQSIIAFYARISAEGYPIHYPKLQAMNLYELIEKLIGIFRLLHNQPKLDYLFRFLDVILQFNLQKDATLGDFLEYWEERKNNLSINSPKDQNAVTVTTIHKSKGLEYPIVIFPFVDFLFTPKKGATMWVHLEDEVFNFYQDETLKILQTALVSINKKLENTPVADQYIAEMQKNFIESLNLLYVAFTRAVQGLYIFTKNEDFERHNDPKKAGPTTVNFLLFLYLLNVNKWESGQTKFVLAESTQAQNQHSLHSEEEVFLIEEFITTEVHKKLRRRGRKKAEQQEE